MAKKNNLVIYEGIEVYRNSLHYKVVLEEEDCAIFVKEETVHQICLQTDIEEGLIAIVLAYIEYVRKNTSCDRQALRKLPEEIIVSSVSCLLSHDKIDIIIDSLKSLKWHEIKEILESPYPLEALEEII